MMKLSQLALSIPQSPTLKLNEKANQLREKGEVVIHLGGGEPKMKTPIDAVKAGVAKLEGREVRYTPTSGTPALKKAIIAYTEKHYGATVGPKNIMVAPGAKAALYSVFLSILDAGDEVVFPAPYWVSYPEMVRLVGAVPVVVPSVGGRLEPSSKDIIARVTPRTKAIILNSPNNPSGAVYSEALVKEMVEFCEARGIRLIMDDIYHQLVFDGRKAVSAYRFSKKPVDESPIIVINGLSKLYGMTGFRIGWAVGPESLIRVMTNVQGQIVSCPSSLSEAAAVGALNGDQDVVDELRGTLMAARDAMLEGLRAIPGVKVTAPGGTFYCLPDFSALNPDSQKLCEFLLEKALVVSVPGKEFGMEGHLRLSYCNSIEEIREGVARIRWALDPSAPREIQIGAQTRVRDW